MTAPLLSARDDLARRGLLRATREDHAAEVRGACLEPRVDDAAAQVYARVAFWVLSRVSPGEGGVHRTLDVLGGPRSAVPDATMTNPLPERDP